MSLDWLIPPPRWQQRTVSIAVGLFSLIIIALSTASLRLGLYLALVFYVSHRFIFVILTNETNF